MLDYIRRHLVVLQSIVIAVVGMLALPLGVPVGTRDAVVAVLAAVLGFVAMIGVVNGDKMVPALVGIAKAVFYLAVLLGAHGFWADPAFQTSVIAVIELGSGLLVAQLVTSNVPARIPPVA
jgi:hypothetical protein